MRKAAAAVLAAVAAGTLGALSPGQAAPPGASPARLRELPETTDARRFPTFDARGVRGRDALWHVTGAGGNCCEVYVAATQSGRLVEYGGTYLAFSDDRGGTWREVTGAVPQFGGEGAVAAAPNGDVVGVGWDAYSGDHLQAFKYDAATREWLHAQVPLHEPVFDRPWIAVVPGPFTRPDGTVAPYATVVRSNYMSDTKQTYLVSLDGLTYVPTTDRAHTLLGLAATPGYLEPAPAPALDYVQPHREARLTPLAAGGLLSVHGGSSRCAAGLWSREQQWSCTSIPGHPLSTALVVDSRGRLHEVEPDGGGALAYRTSGDGGRTWEETTLAMPLQGGVIDGSTLLDHKANGALNVAAVAARVRTGSVEQDVVFRVDTSRDVPRLVETLYVGLGDMTAGAGIDELGERFDFVSVAILPDGTFATAFHDSRSPDPVLAIEVREPDRACARRRRC